MNYHILFLQGGGGKEDYDADAKLVASLREALGPGYTVYYPALTDDESAPDYGRITQIEKEISLIEGEVILAGHSFGASMLLKYLSEHKVVKKITGIFLLATPFWSGPEEWKEDFKLQDDFAEKLPKGVPLFLYHCRDDEEVPFNQFSIYKEKIPWATTREMASGGHQFGNDLTMVAKDIQSLTKHHP